MRNSGRSFRLLVNIDGLGSFLDRWDRGLEDPIRVRSVLNSFKLLLNLIKVSRLC